MVAAVDGERCPFVSGREPFGGGFVDWDAFEAEASFCRLACVLGLRLRARARFSRLESEEGESGSEASDMEAGEMWRFAVAERVMGAK